MTAETIARALGLRRSGHDYVGACPVCNYKTGFSLTERNGKLLVHCAVSGCTFEQIREALTQRGFWPRHEPERKRESADNGERARKLWNRGSLLFAGGGWSVAVDYLRNRGIDLDALLPNNICGVLRFVPDCYHRTKVKVPAMLALVEHQVHGPMAVHRTWLKPDGSGKADLDPNKMTLGPRDGGAIRLAPVGPNGELAVGEGIESSLSFMQLTGTPTWSAISAGGIEALILPPKARLITIACDADPVGIKAAHRAARRWLAEGRRVWIAKPPAGRDFNDVLRARRAA